MIRECRDGKRYYSEHAKRLLVAQSLMPGASASANALANGMNANVLRKWMGKSELLQLPVDADPVLLPVTVEAAAPVTPAEPRSCASGAIQIDLRVRQLRFDGAVDLAVFRPALEGLATR